jgi:hypothetical protein
MLITNTQISMDILSMPYGWRVNRTHEDFVSLRKILIIKYPQTLLPGLPSNHLRKPLNEKQLAKRNLYYERFLVCILKSMTLRGCPFMVDFLRENVPKNFALTIKQNLADNTAPHTLDDLNTLTGEIDVEVSPEAKSFCDGLPVMTDTYYNISYE